MKTKKYTSAILIALTLAISTSLFANEKYYDFEAESYINDIPFSTEQVVKDIKLQNVDFEEEAYIDDIPFSTELVVEQHNYTKATNTSFQFEDEVYVDDIPFDTETVVEFYNFNQAFNTDFEFAEENNVDDIQVNTEVIACFSENAYSCSLSCVSY